MAMVRYLLAFLGAAALFVWVDPAAARHRAAKHSCACLAKRPHHLSDPPYRRSPPQLSCTLDVATPRTRETTLTVQAPATIALKILCNRRLTADKLTVDVTTFRGAQGGAKPVLLSAAGSAGPPASHLADQPLSAGLLAVDLHVPELAAGEKYAGELIAAVADQALMRWPLVLTAAGDRPPPSPQLSCTLGAAAPGTRETALTVQALATIALKILCNRRPTADKLTVDVTTFTGAQSGAKSVLLSAAGTTGSPARHLVDQPLSGGLLAVELHVPELAAGEKYSGELIAAVADQAPMRWPLVLTASSDRPKPLSCTLDVATPGARETTLTVQAPATVPLKLLCDRRPTADKLTVDVTTFTGAQSGAKSVLLSAAGTTGSPARHLVDQPLSGGLLAVELHVPELAAGEKYSGELIAAVADQAPMRWPLVLTPASERPATLVLDRNTVTLTAVQKWWWCPLAYLPSSWSLSGWCPPGDTPTVTVHVRDKSGNWRLDGITARFESGLKGEGSGIDLKKQIETAYGSDKGDDIFAWPAPGKRDVEKGGQATVTLTFKEFEAGEYTIPLRFTARNSGDDDLQRLNVTLQVRRSVWDAVAVIVLAVFISTVATGMVSTLRQRAQLLGRVRGLRPSWLDQQPEILPVIWLRAASRQAADLSRRWWIRGQAELEARITDAERMRDLLARLKQVRDRIGSIPEEKIRQRATWKLDGLVMQIPGNALSEADLAHFSAALDDFAAWSDADPKQRERKYWNDLKPAIAARCTEVLPTSFASPDANNLAQILCGELSAAVKNEPETLQEKIGIQDAYERLSLLWEARSHDRDTRSWVKQIVDLHQPLTFKERWSPILRVYEVVDEGWWQVLTKRDRPKKEGGGTTDLFAWVSSLFRRGSGTPQRRTDPAKLPPPRPDDSMPAQPAKAENAAPKSDEAARQPPEPEAAEPAPSEPGKGEEMLPRIKIVAPTTTVDAYTTIVFRLDSDADPGLMRSYLVQKKLKYIWTIDVYPKFFWQCWRRERLPGPGGPVPRGWPYWPCWLSKQTLTVTSTEPQVAQYVSRPGTVDATVTISYKNHVAETIGSAGLVRVRRSREFGLFASALATGITFVLVVAGSVVTGIKAFALAPTFGSLQDYITLFTWGVGLDQGRNFFQSLGLHAPDAPARQRGSQTGSAGAAAGAGTSAAGGDQRGT
jgi:hypothetical protein